jgi:pyruvate dehydrogenase E2 component (dihydrolipoamide acetyltransferase)
MAVKVEMPKLSDTQSEGTLATWKVSEGDQVESGDVVAEVETDKATMDVEVFDSGTILKILVDEGTTVPLGGLMAVIGEEGEDISDIVEGAGGESSEDGEEKEDEEQEEKEGEDKEKEEESSGESGEEETSEEQETDETEEESEEEKSKEEKSEEEEEDKTKEKKQDKSEKTDKRKKSASSQNGRIKASPLARKMAEEQNIDLKDVEGSGPAGRITKQDIESYEPSTAPALETSRDDQEIKVSQMRKTIARRLSESKFSSPHYYETIDVDARQLIEARSRINDMVDSKISYNDIIVKACAKALRRHPMVNSSWQDDTILQHGDVNIAIAVAIDEGLITPIIDHADQKGLEQIASESKELAEQARNRDLSSEQLEGSTFTVSNLGMFGIEEFTAIINTPNSAILAVGAIRDAPVVEDGELVPGKRMKMTMSSDHRVVDGATAAQFLQTLQNMLETPLSMLL